MTFNPPGPGGTLVWSLDEGPDGMTIDPSTGQVMWPEADINLSPVQIIIRVTNSCGTDTEEWTLTIVQEPVSCEFTLEKDADFTANGDFGGMWTSSNYFGDVQFTAGPAGLCMAVPLTGNNMGVWEGPESCVDLKDYTAYRVKLQMSTDQTTPDAIPLWFFQYGNFYESGRGMTYGACIYFLDQAGGANGIGRPQGRDEFIVWLTPIPVMAPQWRGLLTDGTVSAFDPIVDDINDMKFLYMIGDVDDGNIMAENDSGTICATRLIVESLPLDCLVVDEILYNPPISNATHRAELIGEGPHGETPYFATPYEAVIDDATNKARFHLNPSFDRGLLYPYAAPFDTAALNPVIWEPDTIYRVRVSVQSALDSTDLDPVDIFMIDYMTATNELGAMHFSSRGAPESIFAPDNMFRAGSPRLASVAGGPQDFMCLFHSNNTTVATAPTGAPLPELARWTAFVDVFNTQNHFGDGTGNDPFEVLEMEIARMRLADTVIE